MLGILLYPYYTSLRAPKVLFNTEIRFDKYRLCEVCLVRLVDVVVVFVVPAVAAAACIVVKVTDAFSSCP